MHHHKPPPERRKRCSHVADADQKPGLVRGQAGEPLPCMHQGGRESSREAEPEHSSLRSPSPPPLATASGAPPGFYVPPFYGAKKRTGTTTECLDFPCMPWFLVRFGRRSNDSVEASFGVRCSVRRRPRDRRSFGFFFGAVSDHESRSPCPVSASIDIPGGDPFDTCSAIYTRQSFPGFALKILYPARLVSTVVQLRSITSLKF